MNRGIKRVGVLAVSIISMLSFLSGCGKAGNNGETVTLTEGAELVGLYMTHQGMAMEPHYILRINGPLGTGLGGHFSLERVDLNK